MQPLTRGSNTAMSTPEDGIRPVRLSWELRTTAPLEAAWEALSDTERFNAAAEMGFSFTEEPQPDGTTRRIGRARRLGVLDLEWVEEPWQYRANEWFRCTRRLRGSPAVSFVILCRLRALEGAVDIRYSVEMFPRNIFTRPLVALEAWAFTRPQLDAALKAVLSELDGRPVAFDPRPPPLDKTTADKLVAATRQLKPTTLGRELTRLVMEAPLATQDRIFPLKQAKSWGLSEEETVVGMLEATRAGVLALQWELLCPSCLGPKERPKRLDEVPTRVHCPSCNIYFDATFPDSVAVSFRTGPEYREMAVTTQCIGSPGRQRHVMARDTAEAGDEVDLGLNLEAGSYRVRTWPPMDTGLLEVRADAPAQEVKLAATAEGIQPHRLVVPPGPTRIGVRNTAGRNLEIIVERRSRPAEVLTAGRLLEMPRARELLPPEALGADVGTRTVRCALLAVETTTSSPEAASALKAKVAGYGPRWVEIDNRRLLATWLDAGQALDAARALAIEADLNLAMSLGPVVELTIGERGLPIGQAVDRALAALLWARSGFIAIDAHTAGDHTLLDAVEARGMVTATSVEENRAGVSWVLP